MEWLGSDMAVLTTSPAIPQDSLDELQKYSETIEKLRAEVGLAPAYLYQLLLYKLDMQERLAIAPALVPSHIDVDHR